LPNPINSDEKIAALAVPVTVDVAVPATLDVASPPTLDLTGPEIIDLTGDNDDWEVLPTAVVSI
jgi:hypothetical protein